MKTHTILPGLYQRGHTGRVSLDEKRRWLAENHVGLVLNLWQHDRDWMILPVRYELQPMPDGRVIPEATLRMLVILARDFAKIGQGTLVLCHAGRNRSGLLSAMIVRDWLGVSGTEAMRIVREGRPRAIANPAFAAYLEGLT